MELDQFVQFALGIYRLAILLDHFSNFVKKVMKHKVLIFQCLHNRQLEKMRAASDGNLDLLSILAFYFH